jgi:hypothetical protein
MLVPAVIEVTIPVKLVPDPLNDVAVTIPVAFIPPALTVNPLSTVAVP